MDRRRFLRLSAGLPVAVLGALGCASDRVVAPSTGREPQGGGANVSPELVPKVNGGINVHPLRRLDRDPNEREPLIVPDLVALQLREVYGLGFDGLRITAPFGDRGSFLAAIPYARAARALGIDAVVVLSDFSGFTLAQALYSDRRRPAVLRLYETVFAGPVVPATSAVRAPGRIAFQILNEPTHFLGIPPEVYVNEVLRPCFLELKGYDPDRIVVSAAEVGNVDGPPRIRAMLEAGLEKWCDRLAYHVYSRKVISLLQANVTELVWVTESGSTGTEQHLGWVRDTFPEIRAQIPDVSRIFYYDLFDGERGLYRLLDIQADGSSFRAVVESAELCAFFAQRVATAAAGGPLLGFDTLIPDIRAYYPSASDVRAYEIASKP